MATDTRPTTLTTEHRYNLRNQGWPSSFSCAPNENGEAVLPVITDPIQYTKDKIGVYPSNADVLYLAKLAAAESAASIGTYSPWLLRKYSYGNTPAARGYYILDAFDRNRQSASGLSGTYNPVRDTESRRPVSVAFYAGRVWYLMPDGHLYYSQTVIDISEASKCYQEADPTAEDINELVATDGGEMDVTGIARALRLITVGDQLLILADNGVWSISGGTDTGFTATNQIVRKITDVGVVGPEAAVETEGVVFYWGDGGIYIIAPNQGSGLLEAQNITEATIQTLYNSILPLGKKYARAKYEPRSKKIFWLYNNTVDYDGQTFKHSYNKVLIFDLVLKAFYQYTLPYDTDNLPFVCGLIEKESISFTIEQTNVTDGGVEVTNSSVNVTSATTVPESSEVKLKVFTLLRNPDVSEPMGLGSMAFTGYAPALAETLHAVPVGSATFSGAAPTVLNEEEAFLPAHLVITGYAPSFTTYDPAIPQGALTVAGYKPSISKTIPIGVGSITATGRVPTVNATTGSLNFTNHSISDVVIDPLSATTYITFNTNGSITFYGNGSDADPSTEWWTAQPVTGIGSSYEVAYTVLVSGDAPTTLAGSLGVYKDLSAPRTWGFTQSGTGSRTGTWRFRVRRISDTSVYDEADISAFAWVDPGF